MKKLLAVLFAALLVISGCGQENKENTSSQEVPQRLEVEIHVPEESIQLEQEVTIEAHVSQGGEMVEDADDVQFEIWKSEQDEHEMIEGEHKGEGVYAVTKTFTEEGTYFVVSHVTARRMHNMPKKEFVVGNSEIEDKENAEDSNDSHETHNDGNGIMIHLNRVEGEKAGEAVTLKTHLEDNAEPLTGAKVSYEIWMGNEENHQYTDASEGAEGEYTAEHTFEKAGSYHVTVHVMKDDLHDHKENMIEIQ